MRKDHSARTQSILACLISGGLFFLMSVQKVQAQDVPYSMAVEGDFHGIETKFQDGQSVWVFGRHDSDYILERAKLSVEMTEDPIADDDTTGVKTGKNIRVASLSKPLKDMILIDGAANFSEGAVPSAVLYQDCLDQGNITHEGRCAIEFGSSFYDIKLLQRHETDSDDPQNPYLFDIEMAQGQKNFVMEGIEKIVWAGDMDGDGHLDMIVDDANHYNTWVGLRLYLSSHAKDDDLFGLVAAIRGYGC